MNFKPENNKHTSLLIDVSPHIPQGFYLHSHTFSLTLHDLFTCFSHYLLNSYSPNSSLALLHGYLDFQVYNSEEGVVTQQSLTGLVGDGGLLAVLPDPVVCFKNAIYSQKQVSCHSVSISHCCHCHHQHH